MRASVRVVYAVAAKEHVGKRAGGRVFGVGRLHETHLFLCSACSRACVRVVLWYVRVCVPASLCVCAPAAICMCASSKHVYLRDCGCTCMGTCVCV